ncbi:UDP-N-acetylmuramate dehydrogenase [Candidatus Liberibacter africanus]|uniref:UDP-N-acetylenolpyruvoylglucosamine reductase n=1 Tax=Candidatus Liberibacter africanus PTSAPSY TaxID=1277257 RepID=A0A0G3I420_LIBAF|nr:UDP-N-acetylmuramate dehydrogenase [Candidatus Liberibacter africanus]AKK20634.1 UDP-N-acetylenolpyruvoylglucosamine reductase [Candidatus Liberibacter africanus PTSAPSY]QTP64440.1 UDP-N-acetylmuramate dehydrogenase [Candidatus Liberibacter africanus]
MHDVIYENYLVSLRNKSKQFKGKFQENFPMNKITWFRAGGNAEVMFQPQDIDDLKYFLSLLPHDVPITIVGLGSNILVRDAGIKGIVLRLSHAGFSSIEKRNDCEIIVGASCSGKSLANWALRYGIGGFHFFYGIPGSIGGAAYMNAGSNNCETSQHVVEVHVIDRMGNQHVIPQNKLKYQYRFSDLAKDLIITHVVLRGFQESKNVIQSAIDDVRDYREKIQPIKEKTGGSTFKNPVGRSAWKLIEEAGCRGLEFGGAKISELHCNFMINTNNATGYDLEYLGEKVRKKVFNQSGILLEWEIKRLGEFFDNKIVDYAKIF